MSNWDVMHDFKWHIAVCDASKILAPTRILIFVLHLLVDRIHITVILTQYHTASTLRNEIRMTNLYTLDQIKKVVDTMNFSTAIEAGFVAYSNGEVVVPPVGEMIFDDPPGDTHIKYGFIKGDDAYVIKIASGFYQNVNINLPSSSGLMLVFSQKTGALQTILLDEGFLTNVRTAVAGEIVAKYMAPKNVSAIGVFGTGIMARMQVEILKSVTDCKRVIVWGRSAASLATYKKDMESKGYHVQTTLESADVTNECNLLLMTTPSTNALINVDQIKPGTHISAIGSDTETKQELDTKLFQVADIVIADSLVQCQERGDIYKALSAGDLKMEHIVELGNAIKSGHRIRQTEDQITIADLTGVAIQDVQIAKAVSLALNAESK